MSPADETELVALVEIAHLFQSTEQAPRRLQRALELLRSVVPFDRCTLMFPEEARTRIYAVPPSPDAESTEKVARLTALLLEEQAGEGRFAEHSHLALPLVADDDERGVVLVERHRGEPYDERALRRLSIVCAQLGAYVAYCGVVREQREQLVAIEAESLRLLGFLKGAPAIINYLRGSDLVLEIVHPMTNKLLGPRVSAGKPLLEALPEFRDQPFPTRLRRVFDTGETFHQKNELVRLMLNGRLEDTYWTSTYLAVRDASGHIDGVLTFDLDVTETVRANQERETLFAAAESANRAKDEFLAMLGHELRNPLSPIMTALQVLRLRGIEGGERERTIIERQVEHLVHLVDDLLDVSRITRGKVELKKTRVEISSVVAKAVEAASPLLERKHHRLDIDVPRSGLGVEGDPVRLAQVLSNLLINAAKYTDDTGHIRIEARSLTEAVVVKISDNGMGISADLLPRVFDLFVQQPQGIDRSQGGLGLGLAIVRTLVHLHGGAVAVESKGLGHGSIFTVRLPLAASESVHSEGAPSIAPATAKPASTQTKILVVDDNQDSAEMMAISLTALGHDVRTAPDGPGALTVLHAFTPEVALLDIGLPSMDGYELARRIRELPALRSIHLVAVTGYGQDSDRAKARAAGFDAHLVKPVDLVVLQKTMKRFRESR